MGKKSIFRPLKTDLHKGDYELYYLQLTLLKSNKNT